MKKSQKKCVKILPTRQIILICQLSNYMNNTLENKTKHRKTGEIDYEDKKRPFFNLIVDFLL